VPTIDAKQAQVSVESDKVRIFKEITDSIGMKQFNFHSCESTWSGRCGLWRRRC
jgi:hypothetical protein